MGAARHTRFRENPYRTGLSGIRRERPGPRLAGSTPVRAGRNSDYSGGLFSGLMFGP